MASNIVRNQAVLRVRACARESYLCARTGEGEWNSLHSPTVPYRESKQRVLAAAAVLIRAMISLSPSMVLLRRQASKRGLPSPASPKNRQQSVARIGNAY